VETPKYFAKSGSSCMSGQQLPCSHFETDWLVTPSTFASSSCVTPFCLRKNAMRSLIFNSVISIAPYANFSYENIMPPNIAEQWRVGLNRQKNFQHRVGN